MGVADSLQSISQVLTPIVGGLIIEKLFPGSLGILSTVILFPSIVVALILFSTRFRGKNVEGETKDSLKLKDSLSDGY